MKKSLLVLVAVALAACGSNNDKSTYDQQQTQVAITPKGSIVGRVTELGTATPLAGVSVTLNTPTPVTVVTSDKGTFGFADVVVNSEFQLIFEKDGYVRNTTSALVPGSVNYGGATPLAGGNASVVMSLGKAEGTIKGMVFLPNNRPAVNATVVVDQRRSYLSNVGGGGVGESVVSVKTGMDGSFTLTGLASAPAGVSHRVVAQWFDENADMQADYGSVTTTVDVLGADPSRVFLFYSNIGQTIIDSNVFDGEIGAADALEFTFALPVLTSGQNQAVNDQFALFNLTTGTQIAVEQTWASPVKVSVKPVGGALREGDQFQVNINLKLANSSGFNRSYNFQVRAGTVTGPTTQVTGFTVTNPVRNPNTNFDYADTQFVLSWNSVPGVTMYNVYAKDTTNNQSFVYLTRYTPAIGSGRLTLPLTINNGTYPAFNRGRPLSDSNKLTFAVVAVDGYGNTAPLGAAPAVTVGDNVQPRTNSSAAERVNTSAPVDGINDTAAAATIQLRLRYTEPMDATAAPVYTGSSGAVTQSFVWEAGSNSGIMTLSIPAGGDITGPFTIRGGKDAAGNTLANVDFTGVLGGRKELLVNGGFEDAAGACGVAGWMATGTPAPVSVANNNSSGTGKCAAILGSQAGATPVTGLTKLSQDVVLSAITNPDLGWSYQYSVDLRPEYITTGVATTVTQRCRITDTSDVQIVGALAVAYTSANLPSYSSSSGGLAPMQTIRFQCEVNNATTDSANGALFIDNASVALVKPTTNIL